MNYSEMSDVSSHPALTKQGVATDPVKKGVLEGTIAANGDFFRSVVYAESEIRRRG